MEILISGAPLSQSKETGKSMAAANQGFQQFLEGISTQPVTQGTAEEQEGPKGEDKHVPIEVRLFGTDQALTLVEDFFQAEELEAEVLEGVAMHPEVAENQEEEEETGDTAVHSAQVMGMLSKVDDSLIPGKVADASTQKVQEDIGTISASGEKTTEASQKGEVKEALTPGEVKPGNAGKKGFVLPQPAAEAKEARPDHDPKGSLRRQKVGDALDRWKLEGTYMRGQERANPEAVHEKGIFPAKSQDGINNRQLIQPELITRFGIPSAQHPAVNAKGTGNQGGQDPVNGFDLLRQDFLPQIANSLKEELPVDMARRLVDTVFKEIQVQHGSGKDDGEIRVRLKPDTLGEVVIRVAQEDGRIIGRILVENLLVRDALENRLPELRQRLDQQGIDIKEMHVGLGSDADRGNGRSLHHRKNGSLPRMQSGTAESPQVGASTSSLIRGVLDILA